MLEAMPLFEAISRSFCSGLGAPGAGFAAPGISLDLPVTVTSRNTSGRGSLGALGAAACTSARHTSLEVTVYVAAIGSNDGMSAFARNALLPMVKVASSTRALLAVNDALPLPSLSGLGTLGRVALTLANVAVPVMLGSTPGLGAPETASFTVASPEGANGASDGMRSFHGAMAVVASKEKRIASLSLNGTSVPDPRALSACTVASMDVNSTPSLGVPSGRNVPCASKTAGTPAGLANAPSTSYDAAVASTREVNASAVASPSKAAVAVISPPSFGAGFPGAAGFMGSDASEIGAVLRSPFTRAPLNTSVDSASRLKGPAVEVISTLGSVAPSTIISTELSSNTAAPKVPESVASTLSVPSCAGSRGFAPGFCAARVESFTGPMDRVAPSGLSARSAGLATAPSGPMTASTRTSCASPNTAAARVAVIFESRLTFCAEKSMSRTVRSIACAGST